MVDIKRLQDYLQEIKDKVPAITITYLVIDDSQITELMKEVKDRDMVLLALVPSHGLEGAHEDNVRSKDLMAFLVMHKADRKMKHVDFIDNLHKCQLAGKEIVNKLILDKPDFEDGCSIINMLEVPSIKMDPVWQLAGADGYQIDYFLYSKL